MLDPPSTKSYSYFKDIYQWRRTPRLSGGTTPGGTTPPRDTQSTRYIKIAARLLVFLLLNVVFILAGTAVFMRLEGPAEVRRKEAVHTEYLTHWAGRNVTRLAVARLLRHQEVACRTKNTSPWSFRHAMHMTYSVITTIGFGELAPKTVTGKLVTVIYGAVGIVLNIMCLACLRVILTMMIYKVLWWYMKIKRGITRRTRTTVRVTLTLTLILLLWTITSLFTYSRTPSHWLVNFYNTFIAVTTVGFGDNVILDDFNEYLNLHHDLEPNGVMEMFLQLIFMVNIILILALFSTLFEQLKQTNVRRVSKRVSHIVNIIQQSAHTETKRGKYLTTIRETRLSGEIVDSGTSDS